jgi:mono/diheme cytochrome c family protein
MKRISIPQSLFWGLILGLSSVGFAQITVKQVPARPTTSVEGKDLYREYCAACHGIDGKGAGPAAIALKQVPTDLTRIARVNNGSFPEESMLRVLKGEESPVAHGTGAMPVWGAVFSNMSPNIELTQLRMHALLDYLEKIQTK